MPAYQNPLSGNPRTIETRDRDGLPVFTVIACELTPERAKFSSQVSSIVGWGLAGAAGYYLYRQSSLDWGQAAVAVVVAGACHYGFRTLFTDFMRRTTKIIMTVEAIQVRRWIGWASYKRSVPHQFLLAPHDQTPAEQRDHEFIKRKDGLNRSVTGCPVYYGDSFHVVLLYAGQRIDLADVYGPRAAAAIVARLQYCDDALDFAIGKGHRTGHDAARNWNRPTPGGIK